MPAVWRLAYGSPVGDLLRHRGLVAWTRPDGTPVIISGGHDGTIRMWHTADGAPVMPPLDYLNRYRPSPFTTTSSLLWPGQHRCPPIAGRASSRR
jgi:WD40 repeat protein